MSLQVSDYPNRFGDPLPEAYVWICCLAIDFASGLGTVQLNVHQDGAAALAGKAPVAQPAYLLGGDLPSLAEVVADNQAAFDAIRDYLYDKLKALPEFTGATEVA